MNFEFEINNQILKRIDSQEVVSKNHNIYRCRFTFATDSDWVTINKFVIFHDGWGNSTTVHLGKGGGTLCCLIPNEVLDGSYFKVSIYGGDLLTTNAVSIPLIESGYTEDHHNGYSTQKDIFVEIFEELETTIDSIVFNDNCLHLFNKGKLIDSVFLPYATIDSVQELMQTFTEELKQNESETHRHTIASNETDGFMSSNDKNKLDSIEENANHTIVDGILDETSENPISNNAVTLALNGKEDTYDFVERMDTLIQNLIYNGD